MIQVLPLRSETLPPATETNCLLFDSPVQNVSTFWVVDPGSPFEDQHGVLNSAIQRRIDAGQHFAGVVLTHRHRDHVSGAAAVVHEFACPVIAHPITKSELAGKVAVTAVVEEGDRLGEAQVLFTPGHAQGHICLWFEATRELILGDMVAGVGSILIASPDGEMGAYLSSLERLKALLPAVLYPAHGPTITEAVPKLEHYLRHRRLRERKILDAVGREPCALSAIVPLAYDDTPEHLWPLAEYAAQAHLLHLQKQKLIESVPSPSQAHLWRRI